MDTIDFICPRDGEMGKEPVKIKVPTACCGIQTKISKDFYQGLNQFDSHCRVHLLTYDRIWRMWLENKSKWKRRRPCKFCAR